MKYDVIIVGAGSSGIVLANRLTEDENLSVLLLEAGADYPDLNSLPKHIKVGVTPWYDEEDGRTVAKHTWGYEAIATPRRKSFSLPRGKVTGGSSAINGQVWFRGIPEDFDEWDRLGNKGWSYLDVLPFFRKSETDLDFLGDDFHGSDGPIPVKRYQDDELLPAPKAFLASCQAMGFPFTEDMNHPDSTGVGFYPINRVDGVRMSTAVTYLEQSRHRLNLTVRANVMVQRVLFENLKAVGVEVFSGGEIFKVFGEKIILSGGAINSPQLLMLSGIGPSDNLSSFGIKVLLDLPGVGKNLRDHPAVYMQYVSENKHPKIVPPLQIGMRYTTPASRFRNDMSIRPLQIRTEHMPVDFNPEDGFTPTGFSIALQKALSAGEIRLASADPQIQPILDYRYFSHPYDLERVRDAVRLCAEITSRPEFDPARLTRFAPTDDALKKDKDLDEWILSNATTQHHSSGTCKMGPSSDHMAVVDSNCHVHGLSNLLVVDASIMPDVTRSNTNAPTIMIAEKMASHILEH